MKTKITESETRHLLKNAPMNHVLSITFGNAVSLIAKEDSWEFKELKKIRRLQRTKTAEA
jgi:hypothetical protein